MSLNFGQNLFPPRKEFLLNFDYKDLVTGKGYIEYFIGKRRDTSTTEINFISREQFVTSSSVTENQQIAKTGDFTLVNTDNYDLTIDKSVKIEGKFLIDLYWEFYATQASGLVLDASTDGSGYIIIKVIKDSGGATTTLGTYQSATQTASLGSGINTNATYSTFEKIALTIANTTFIKNDKIRIAIESWLDLDTKRYDETTCYISTKHYLDPQNLLATAVNYNDPGAEGEAFEYRKSKTFKINIPFDLRI